MTNSVHLLRDFKSFKKLYPYYLKSIVNTSFWVFVSLGVVLNGINIFTSWKVQGVAPNYKKEIKEIQKSAREGDISDLKAFEKIKEKSDKLREKSFFGWVGGNFSTSSSLADYNYSKNFWISLNFSFIWMLFPFISDYNNYKQICTLLALISSSSRRQKKQRTGEDEMILIFTPTVTRFVIAISKFLAYLTRCLIINFVWFVLPYLLEFSNWTNHLGLLLKLLGFGGLLLPLVFFSFSSCFFYWLELNKHLNYVYLLYLVSPLILMGLKTFIEKYFPQLSETLEYLISNYSKIKANSLTPHFILPAFLSFDSLFFYLYYRDFQNTDFS